MGVDIKKLAILAGFTVVEVQACSCHPERKRSWWNYPNGNYYDNNPPDFLNDLNACFRWLPEPLRKRYEVVIFIDPVEDANFSKVGVRGIFKDVEYWERAEWLPWLDSKTPNRTYLQEVATALCKAVRRLAEECSLCGGTNEVLVRPTRLVGATYIDGHSGDERVEACELCNEEER